MSCRPMELRDTIPNMVSPDYRERFIAEYEQTAIRYAKLVAFVNRINYAKAHELTEPKHDCPVELLEQQIDAMSDYLMILSERAEIEKVDLPPFHKLDDMYGVEAAPAAGTVDAAEVNG